MTFTYPFTKQEWAHASQTWNANCGPTALAFAAQVKLDRVRAAMPDFEQKGYTSPSMMMRGIKGLGREWRGVADPSPALMFHERIALVRIQWSGPWTKPGANPRWAYTHTHWIATWKGQDAGNVLFDVNGGLYPFDDWKKSIVPMIVSHIQRADGGWSPTHIWRLVPEK